MPLFLSTSHAADTLVNKNNFIFTAIFGFFIRSCRTYTYTEAKITIRIQFWNMPDVPDMPGMQRHARHADIPGMQRHAETCPLSLACFGATHGWAGRLALPTSFKRTVPRDFQTLCFCIYKYELVGIHFEGRKSTSK